MLSFEKIEKAAPPEEEEEEVEEVTPAEENVTAEMNVTEEVAPAEENVTAEEERIVEERVSWSTVVAVVLAVLIAAVFVAWMLRLKKEKHRRHGKGK